MCGGAGRNTRHAFFNNKIVGGNMLDTYQLINNTGTWLATLLEIPEGEATSLVIWIAQKSSEKTILSAVAGQLAIKLLRMAGITYSNPFKAVDMALEILVGLAERDVLNLSNKSPYRITTTKEILTFLVQQNHEFDLTEPQYVWEMDKAMLGGWLKAQYYQHQETDSHLYRMNTTAVEVNPAVLDMPLNPTAKQESDKEFPQFKQHVINQHKEVLRQRLYLPHKYDNRGRCYCSNYLINYQGIEWQKAAVQLYNKELVKER